METDKFCKRLADSINLPQEMVNPIAQFITDSKLNILNHFSVIEAKKLLSKNNIGVNWNKVLDIKRAKYLAQIIFNLIKIENTLILDVLSGTGTVAKELRNLGCKVIEIDRLKNYPEVQKRKDRYLYDLEDEWDNVVDLYPDVVLVITSLHHEENIDYFLGRLANLNTKRFIIIENLRTEETDYILHQRMDWFFNNCLNDFGADCPGWYWDRKQWEQILSTLGNVEWKFSMNDVPGIPFSYDLFDINR